MKDESRAKWPELIAEQNKATAQMTGHQVWYVKAPIEHCFYFGCSGNNGRSPRQANLRPARNGGVDT